MVLVPATGYWPLLLLAVSDRAFVWLSDVLREPAV
jgi:hypothetical protein